MPKTTKTTKTPEFKPVPGLHFFPLERTTVLRNDGMEWKPEAIVRLTADEPLFIGEPLLAYDFHVYGGQLRSLAPTLAGGMWKDAEDIQVEHYVYWEWAESDGWYYTTMPREETNLHLGAPRGPRAPEIIA